MKRHALALPLLAILMPTLASMASATPIVKVTADTELVFTVNGTGGAITANKTWFVPGQNKFFTSPSGFWSLSLTISEVEKPSGLDPNDKLIITGVIQHLMSPTNHGDGVGVAFNLTGFGVDADNATGDPAQVTDSLGPISQSHGTHHDTLTGSIVASVLAESLGTDDDILSYAFTIDVRHCNSCPADPPFMFPVGVPVVPEPSSLALLSIGFAVLGSRIQRGCAVPWTGTVRITSGRVSV